MIPMTMNPVIHFEMPANDRKRMSAFYAKAFGWETNQLGPEMGNYVVVMTTESTKEGPKKKGIINGGFYQREPNKTDQYPSLVIAVENLAAHMKQVQAAGGRISGQPMDIPGVGRFASFFDTEGNRVSMLQPLAMAKAKTTVKKKAVVKKKAKKKKR